MEVLKKIETNIIGKSLCQNKYHKKDKLIADCFDDYRRSTAIYKILHLLYNKIITDDEFEGFSSETKEIVEKIKEINDRT
ncbi:MAG: hypothetical protein MUF15_09475 [Acidobacteria bacterium]|nr:hypothetical protein [Acidobacteriota bacterium]